MWYLPTYSRLHLKANISIFVSLLLISALLDLVVFAEWGRKL